MTSRGDICIFLPTCVAGRTIRRQIDGAEKSPDNCLTCRDIWGPKGDGFAVMQSLKDRFDPAGILNPGRFIFEPAH